MTVIPIPAFTDNYIWAIPDNAVFDCVDPGEAEPVLHFAKTNQLKLRSILLTHHHHDHIGGVSELLTHYPSCQIYGPDDSRIPWINHPVKEHQQLSIGQHSFQILYNPGHTSTHISYYEPQKGWLFCGDTLFSAGCGRVFDGTMAQLYQSMQLFKTLPPQTKVFCAHEYTRQNLRFAQTVEPHNPAISNYLHQLQNQKAQCTLPSTLDKELQINPFLRTDSPEVQTYARLHGAHSNDPFDVFQIIRLEKNKF